MSPSKIVKPPNGVTVQYLPTGSACTALAKSITASAPKKIRTRGCTGLASSARWVTEELRGQPNVLAVRTVANAARAPTGRSRGQARARWEGRGPRRGPLPRARPEISFEPRSQRLQSARVVLRPFRTEAERPPRQGGRHDPSPRHCFAPHPRSARTLGLRPSLPGPGRRGGGAGSLVRARGFLAAPEQPGRVLVGLRPHPPEMDRV